MPGGDADVPLRQHPRHTHPRIIFRRERDDPRQSSRRIEQTIHRIAIGRAHGIFGMRAAIAVHRTDERALDVDAADDVADQRIALAQLDDSRQPPRHLRQVLGDDGGQDSRHAVVSQRGAGAVQVVGTQVVALKVDAEVAVHLEVEIAGRSAHGELLYHLIIIKQGAFSRA